MKVLRGAGIDVLALDLLMRMHRMMEIGTRIEGEVLYVQNQSMSTKVVFGCQ